MKASQFISIALFTIVLSNISCNKDETANPPSDSDDFVRAVDISSFPKISEYNPVFNNLEGIAEDFLIVLINSGVNTIRLRLWVDPVDEHSGFEEVKQFYQTLKSKGFKIWLSLHYSDTWADPGNQTAPARWQNISFTALKDSVYLYTKNVVQTIKPDIIQIGNEINPGILFPYGHIDSQFQQFEELLSNGIEAVRNNSDSTKIMLHFAGLENAEWFCNQVNKLDYDIIGLSYYPIWHGKDLSQLSTTIENLNASFNKEIVIAETAYPFTLAWNDWTNNIVGLEDQLILPLYGSTAEGQQAFVHEIRRIVTNTQNGLGFCYWGGELIAFDGPESVNGSPWENQALFDFNNRALPVLDAFNK